MFIFFLGNSQSNYESLKDSIKVIMERENIPGLFVSVVNHDSEIWKGGFGYACIDPKVVVANQMFRIGSVTKTFTAIAVMKLVSEGKLNLNDKLSEVAPEVPFDNPWEDTNPVLIHHLLEHKAGFDDMHFAGMVSRNAGQPITALDEVMAHKNSLVCRWEPGLVHSYSNPSYVILGYLIEKFSGYPYQKYISDVIMRPLEMKNTFFTSQMKAREAEMATGYAWYNNTINQAAQPEIMGESAGALATNVNDFGRFARLFLNRGTLDTTTVLAQQYFDELESIHGEFELLNNIKFGYSLGLYHRQYGSKEKYNFLGHSGGTLGFGSDFIYNRELDIAIAISNNGETGNRKILDILVDYFVRQPIVSTTGDSLSYGEFEIWEGTYLLKNSRNEILRFVDLLASTVKLKTKNNGVATTEFLSSAKEFVHAKGGGLIEKGNSFPTLFPCRLDGEEALQYKNDLYIRVNPTLIFLLRVVMIASIMLCALSIIILLIRTIIFLFNPRLHYYSSLIFSLPNMVFALMMYIFISLLPLHRITNAGVMNIQTVTIYILSILLPVATIFSFIYLILKWKTYKRKIKYLYLGSVMGASFLAIYLATMGWVGMALWKY